MKKRDWVSVARTAGGRVIKKIRRKKLNEILIETRERIDISRRNRFKCEKCCLTESAQYKILFAEGIAKQNDR
jgi:hypothetical protein